MQEFRGNSHISFAEMGTDFAFAGVFPREMAVAHGLSYQKPRMALSLEDFLQQTTPVLSPLDAYNEKRTASLFKALALATTAVIAISSFAPKAQAIDWSGAASTDFATDGNWVGGLAPGGADTADISTSAINPAIVSASASVNELNVNGGVNAGDLTIIGGSTLTVNLNTVLDGNGVIQGVGQLDTLMTFDQNGGTVSVTALQAGSFDIDGGTTSSILRTLSAPTATFTVSVDNATHDQAANFINANSNNNEIDIDVASTATISAKTGTVITTNSGTANTDIHLDTNIQTSGGNGIFAQSTSGNVTISDTRNVTSGSTVNGIVTSTSSGNINITTGGIIDAPNAVAIFAQSLGGGTITIDPGAAIGGGTAPNQGMDVNTNHNVIINADENITAIIEAIDIFKTNTATTGTIDINVTAGTITSNTGTAIDVNDDSAQDVDIDITGGTVNGSTRAVLVDAEGGDVDVNIAGAATIGDTTARTVEVSTTGTGTVNVRTDTALTSTGNNTIRTSSQNGNTIITTNALITSNGNDAILGQISGVGSTGTVTINVNAGATGGGAQQAVDVVTRAGTGTVNNAAGSTLQSASEATIRMLADAGVAQTLDNSGTILGEILGDDNNLTVENRAGGVWQPAGSNGGTHTSDFGDSTDTLNNAGTLRVADDNGAPNAAIVTMSGLENVTNTGTITLQNAVAALTTDRLTITPSAGNTATFNGGGTLSIDADLGGGGTADLVTIGTGGGNDGTVTGTTTLNVNNTNPGGTGTVGERITVIRVADSGVGTTNAANFNLAAPVVIGNVQYDLEFVDNDGSGFDLFQLVGAAAAATDQTVESQQAQTQTASMNLFHEAVNAMVDRQGDTRDNIAEYGKSGGFWMHTFGSVVDRTGRGSAVTGGATTTSDTSYDQVTYGIYAGVDKSFKGITKDSDYLMVGAYGGYLGADVDFKATSSKINYSGATLGLYSTYIDEGFYLDTLVKADIMKATISDGPNNTSAKTDLLNLGGRIGFGYKMVQKDGTYLDPFGKLTYVHTSIDDYTIGANAVSMDDGESLRGQLGSRFGKNFEENGTKYDVFVTASIIHEFDGKAEGTINAATNITEDNDLTLVNLGLGVDVEMPMEGVNFFARANTDIGDDYFGYSGKFGFNIKL